MTTITDESIREMLAKAKPYCLLILKSGPRRNAPDAAAIIWEHGRRNFVLRAEGKLPVVCPVPDGGDVCGIGLFNTACEEAKRLMDDDPGVKAGTFVYELHGFCGFPR